MVIEQYQALFNGEVLPGVNPDTAKQNLARLFKTDLTKIQSLFTGKPFVLKKGMTLEEAQRCQSAFERTGTRCHIVKMPVPQTPQPRQSPTVPQTPQPGQSPPSSPTAPPAAPPTPPAAAPVYEVRYNVVFNGDILPGKKKDDVILNLAQMYKMEYQKVSQFFTGRSITVKGPTDFWTASEYMKRFMKCGAVCELQSVEPTTAPTPKPDTAPVQPTQPVPAAAPVAAPVAVAVAAAAGASPQHPAAEMPPAPANEAEEIKSKSDALYESLTKAYRYILAEYHIEKKSKKLEAQEGTIGCLFLLILGGIIALVIWTPMRWYTGLLFGFGLVILFSLFMKNWDLKYVDVFLSRMESFKKKDPVLFLVTLNKWVNDLPAKDRARIYLQNLTAAAIRENPDLKPELDKYAEIIGPLVQTIEDEMEELEKELETETSASAAAAAVPKNKPKKTVAKKERKILCPRCGSNFITEDSRGFSWGKGIAATLFFGPLAGAVVGSSKQGEAIYVCGNCNKKWKR